MEAENAPVSSPRRPARSCGPRTAASVAAIPIIGPELAPAAALGMKAFVMSLVGLEKGGFISPHLNAGGALAVLHKGELVAPAPLASQILTAMNSSSTTTNNQRGGEQHFHYHAPGGAATPDMQDQMKQFAKELRRQNLVNPWQTPGGAVLPGY
jgi:hypothetical protein